MRNSVAPPRALLTAGFVLALLGTAASAACLKDNADGQTAEGTLTVTRAKDAAGRTERPYILRLAGDACLDTQDPEDAVKATRTIHVYPSDENAEPAFRRLLGKMVTVSGNPFAAHTAHHHAPIVMRVENIKLVTKR